ncbi:hypothetical protein B0A55_05358 [Friedmanniomyces simplex]|uniref:Transmembrane protein n=1 Tax=Friedmanniomyces simplex TaxID=329884 RepID=A0A4U0XE80_9PEZI|nr:hypothetical protein B0A55_05358 [Friedmanniomyces simplex]
MAGLPDASSPELKISQAFGNRASYWPAFREKRIDAYARSTGAMSQPGRVVSANERRRRKEASISSMDGVADEKPEDDHGSFAWLGRKMQAEAHQWKGRCLNRLDRDIESNFGPEACPTAVQEFCGVRTPLSARSFICLLVAFLIVFGALYTLMEHLLFATRASAACTPTTIYMPVTYTTTVTYTPSPSDASAIGASSSATISTIHSTIYSTSTLTNTVTLLSAPSSGATPSTSYVATVTTTQLVSPVSTVPSTTGPSSPASAETFIPPAYTSTTFSFVSPAITVTSTSTLYSTVQISYATPSSSSYAGMGPSGWNSSSGAVASPAMSSASGTPVVETLTATYYWGTGNATTSTATTLLTTTITHIVQQQLGSRRHWCYYNFGAGHDRERDDVELNVIFSPSFECPSISRRLAVCVRLPGCLPERDFDEHCKRLEQWSRDRCLAHLKLHDNASKQQHRRQLFGGEWAHEFSLVDSVCEQLDQQRNLRKLDNRGSYHIHHEHTPIRLANDHARDD